MDRPLESRTHEFSIYSSLDRTDPTRYKNKVVLCTLKENRTVRQSEWTGNAEKSSGNRALYWEKGNEVDMRLHNGNQYDCFDHPRTTIRHTHTHTWIGNETGRSGQRNKTKQNKAKQNELGGGRKDGNHRNCGTTVQNESFVFFSQ